MTSPKISCLHRPSRSDGCPGEHAEAVCAMGRRTAKDQAYVTTRFSANMNERIPPARQPRQGMGGKDRIG